MLMLTYIQSQLLLAGTRPTCHDCSTPSLHPTPATPVWSNSQRAAWMTSILLQRHGGTLVFQHLDFGRHLQPCLDYDLGWQVLVGCHLSGVVCQHPGGAFHGRHLLLLGDLLFQHQEGGLKVLLSVFLVP